VVCFSCIDRPLGVFLVILTSFSLVRKKEVEQRLPLMLIVHLLIYSFIAIFSLIYLCMVVTLLGIRETDYQ